jgi:pimeloyl-ACP methyl ester carboxylesterase
MTDTATHATALRLATTDAGRGEPALLLVPGWCGDRTVFDALVAGAAPHHRAVSVDLPAHGESPDPGEFGTADVVDALVATLEELKVERVVPVALSHAGWAAIALRGRLGPEVVPGVVLLDWMVLGTPPGFADALAGLRSPHWQAVSDGLRAMWTAGLDIPALSSYVDSMGRYGEAHWARAGREIAAGFAEHPVPLEALAALQPCPTLHLYAQPAEDAVLAAQQAYAQAHPWFEVHRLEARSHFPMFEVPEEMAERIEQFVTRLR